MLAVDQPGETVAEPLSILQFVMTLGQGGAEKLAADLAIGLRREGHRVTVAAHHAPEGARSRRLSEQGVDLVQVTFPKPGVLAIVRCVRDVRNVLIRTRPQVVHAHNPGPGVIALVARILARQRDVPIVTTYHGVRPHRRKLAGRLLRMSDGVIAVGPAARDQLRGVTGSTDVSEIRNAVMVDRTRSADDVRAELGAADELLFVSVGRHVEQKGQDFLVDVAAELRRRERLGRPFRLVIVGEGPLEAELRAQAEQLGCSSLVVFTGPRSDAADIIAAADALLHSAHWEGLPLVLLEAMSVGTPIVALDAVGVTDVVRDGVTGLLVRDRTPSSFADAVERIVADPALRELLVAEGRRLIDREHSPRAMIDDHVALYRRLIEARRRRQ